MPPLGLPSPLGVVRLAVEITKAVVDVVERSVLEVDHEPRALPAAPEPRAIEARRGPVDPALRMRQLLEESTRLDGTGSGGLTAMVVAELVPDEARLLAALSDGEFAALSVTDRGGRGRAASVLLRTSTAGRAAGIREHELLPVYLGRLEARGLIAFTGLNGVDHARDFELLQVEGCVVDALADLRARGGKPRLERGALRLSLLGRQVWDSTRIS